MKTMRLYLTKDVDGRIVEVFSLAPERDADGHWWSAETGSFLGELTAEMVQPGECLEFELVRKIAAEEAE